MRRTEIGPIVFEYRKEKNPCALCAKLRRGALHTAAQELGCNKVALGHHLDDAVETFYMNLWREGRIGCFSPVTYLSRRDLTLIRPMLLATETRGAAVPCRRRTCPSSKSRCPADGVTVREQTKEFVRERCRIRPRLPAERRSCSAGERHRRRWRPVHTRTRQLNPYPKEGNESCRDTDLLKNTSGLRSISTPFAVISAP
ncbi:MAG: ATP-binding protein [Faecalibacterium prausnitzii]